MSSCKSHPIPSIRNNRASISSDLCRSIRLIKRSHKPQDILDVVKRLTVQPDYFQQKYKSNFVECYQNWIGMETPDDVHRLEELKGDLQMAMQALDAFFFAGSLTRPRPYGKYGRPVADLKVQNNIFAMGQPGHRAYFKTGQPLPLGLASPKGDGRTTIFIDTLRNGSPMTVESTFETLVHEMAHAIFLSFACGGADCKREAKSPRILGQRGHGNMWLEMAEHMRNTIQTWDEDLADFYSTDDLRWHNRECN